MKYALITGGTKGIGKSIAAALLGDGYHVILNYANDDLVAHQTKEAFEVHYPGMVSLVKHKLDRNSSIDDFCNKIIEISPILNVLVLNYGKTDRSKIEDITVEAWNDVFEANVTIPFFIIQKLLSNIAPQGSILFIGSSMGVYPHSLSISYGVSKSAVHALVKNLVKFLSPMQIRINAAVPGFVDTEWQAEKPAEIRASIESKIALERFSSPDEIADACMFLIQNTYMNGELLQIDGGYNYK